MMKGVCVSPSSYRLSPHRCSITPLDFECLQEFRYRGSLPYASQVKANEVSSAAATFSLIMSNGVIIKADIAHADIPIVNESSAAATSRAEMGYDHECHGDIFHALNLTVIPIWAGAHGTPTEAIIHDTHKRKHNRERKGHAHVSLFF